MSILGSIFSKILGHHGAAAPAGGAGTGAASPGVAGAPVGGWHADTPISVATPTPQIAGSPPPATPPASPPPVAAVVGTGSAGTPSVPAAGTAKPADVDVAAILTSLAASSGETLDWRHSIVDMMKLLGLDSSLSARQALAQELHYSGDTHDSATMNVWLHKQVMSKLAENGGKVPAELRA